MRNSEEGYQIFRQHQEAFDNATTFLEFCQLAGLKYLEAYAGGWAEETFETAKAGKFTHRSLRFPKAAKFSDLFAAAYFIPTDQRDKPKGACYVSGLFSKGSVPVMHCGGVRSWHKGMVGDRSHSGCKFFGTYVIPTDEVQRNCQSYFGKDERFSFEAITREDSILIIARWPYPEELWLALLDNGETIEELFDEPTKAFLAAERQAEIEAWGDKA